MLRQLRFIQSNSLNPYHNLALEEWLLTHCRAEECILYLWQNQKTVVIGRNQNAWKECRVEHLEAEGGHLARRLSGGGAVYHDLGNLNFTFLTQKPNYNVERQTEVILQAVQQLGIRAERSGRNDLLVEGKKFSGHAYYRQGVHCYHHGTLMVAVDGAALSSWLTVDPEKLHSKGVDSVRSRVANLQEYCPSLTIPQLKDALLESFSRVYQLEVTQLPHEELDMAALAERQAVLSSWQWLLGQRLPFQYELNHRFPWGSLHLQLEVQGGIIREVAAYSDALATEPVAAIPAKLKGLPFQRQTMAAALEGTISALLPGVTQWLKEIEL